MTTGLARKPMPESTTGSSPRRAVRPSPTISACCQAILAHFAVDPESASRRAPGEAFHGGLCVEKVSRTADHLAMTLHLPMPYGTARMTISTIGAPGITLPGMSLSPAIAAAAVGQPIGRLTGHPAFAELDHLVVTSVRATTDAHGRAATLLCFEDRAEPLFRVSHGAISHSVH